MAPGTKRKVGTVARTFAEGLVSLAANEPVTDALVLVNHSCQRSFPVFDGARLLGLVSARTLFQSAILGHGDAPVGSLTRWVEVSVGPDDDLETAIDRFELADDEALPVVSGGRMIGVLLQEDVLAPAEARPVAGGAQS